MMNDLKNLFRDAWSAFAAEAGRRDPEDHVAELLSAMRRETVEARASLPGYEDAARRADAELARERTALDDAVRRGALAERIGDAETSRIAAEFAERHRRRVEVLEEKARAAQAELRLRQEESAEMLRRYKEADLNRFALVAEVRARAASARIHGAMGAPPPPRDGAPGFDESAAYRDALDELDGRPPPPPPVDVEARLAELKRRMGQG